MSKPRQVKSYKSDTVHPSQMIWRAMEVLPDTINAEAKSVDVVVASDNPVQRWDDQRGGVVSEVLAMSGVEYRGGKSQLPIVDSHNRSTIRNVLGSVRNLRTEGGQLVGTATFARNEDSQEAYQKLIDGHLTDFSITATPIESQFIPRGEITRVGDRQIQGPAEIVTRWMPTDASLVAVGADETATVRDVRRSYQITPDMEVQRMLSEEMKAALVAKGMPEQLTDVEQALAWAVGVLGANQPAEAASEPEAMPEPVEMADEPMAEEKPAEEPAMDAKEEIAKALKADQIRRKEIVALCKKAKIERAFADSLCDEGLSLDVARSKVLERLMETKPVGASAERIEFTASADDKRYAAMRDGLVQRSFVGAGLKRRPFDNANPAAAGSEDFRYASLLDIAKNVLRWAGGHPDRMAPRDIAAAALGSTHALERCGIRRDAYHTTGTFVNLLVDASNKTLLAGYEEAPYTWSTWARQASSVPDFKNINRVQLGESPDPEMIPERHEYKEKAVSDRKVTYKAEKYGALFSVSLETIINDDTDALSRIPAMHGAACRRKQNKTVYDVLTSNPTMSDTYSLFSASHPSGSNYTSSGTAISTTSLNVAFGLMMLQKGLDSSVILGLQPRFLIVPPDISGTALQVVTSIADPTASGNSGVNNIYGPNGVRPLQVVVEAQLSANDANAWYLAADTSQVDTVELAFLQGEESPVLEREDGFINDTVRFKVRQSWGVAAIDWRGLYLNAGA